MMYLQKSQKLSVLEDILYHIFYALIPISQYHYSLHYIFSVCSSSRVHHSISLHYILLHFTTLPSSSKKVKSGLCTAPTLRREHASSDLESSFCPPKSKGKESMGPSTTSLMTLYSAPQKLILFLIFSDMNCFTMKKTVVMTMGSSKMYMPLILIPQSWRC